MNRPAPKAWLFTYKDIVSETFMNHDSAVSWQKQVGGELSPLFGEEYVLALEKRIQELQPVSPDCFAEYGEQRG